MRKGVDGHKPEKGLRISGVQILLLWPTSGSQQDVPKHRLGKRDTEGALLGCCEPAPVQPSPTQPSPALPTKLVTCSSGLDGGHVG